ncbi:TrkH family potassium uptake protein [Hippea maritima]|uniref:Potassium uptake protein, TrkH family n=1 Tax=Hippea maritima (strain ATCC 700847 / DSM 10411 / MH2) TaxID=760142 RepID=F2LXZ2_HIPMA|nr:TrkH family potassium uptake protein [Hippea maritima]AEA33257.1 potassium uptake protein, TrkH family [Hippea maritima DSM 10411]
MTITKNPLKAIVLGFFAVIVLGCVLLLLPFSSKNGTSLVDALFTSTSAVCVTGLITLPMSHFTLFGQIVILALIQVGGFGYMSMTSFVMIAFKRKLTYKDKLLLKEALNYPEMHSITSFFKRIMFFGIFCELVGAIILMFAFAPKMGLEKGLYYAVFHSISAFNNAGFSLFADSLVGYKYNVVVNFTIMSLIVLGGIGFIVIDELFLYKKGKISYLSLHTKAVLSFTAALIIGGALLIFLLERNGILAHHSFLKDALVSFFQSITTRTAGFNTIDLSYMHNSTIFLFVILMFIGASPGGTGGGIKTTTAFVVLKAIYSYIRGEKDVNAFKRRVSDEVVYKSFVVLSLSFIVVSLSSFILSDIENVNFLKVLFESVSAISTVGLSIGNTNVSLSGSFDDLGKLIIIVLMFVGRVGLFSFSVALFRRKSTKHYRLAEGRIFV